MRELLGLILSLFIPLCAGYGIVSFLGAHSLKQLEIICASFPLGLFLLTLDMFFISLTGMQYSLPAIIFFISPFMFLSLYSLIMQIKGQNPYKKNNVQNNGYKRTNFSLAEKLLFFAIGAVVLYVFCEGLLSVLAGGDAMHNFAVKGKIFFYKRGISIDLYKNIYPYTEMWMRDYPLMIPLNETWISLCTGQWDGRLIKIFFPVMYLCTIFLFYFFLTRHFEKRYAQITFFIFATLPILIRHGTLGYADIYISVFYFMGIYNLLLFAEYNNSKSLVLSSIFSSGMVWIKNEGILLFLSVALTLFFIFYVYSVKSKIKQFFIYSAFPFFAIIPWFLFKQRVNIQDTRIAADLFSINEVVKRLLLIPTILYEIQKRLFSYLENWYILWYIFLFALLAHFSKKIPLNSHQTSDKKNNVTSLVILTTIGVNFSLYVLAYCIAATDVTRPLGEHWIHNSIHRLLLHFTPLVVFFIAYTLYPLYQKYYIEE